MRIPVLWFWKKKSHDDKLQYRIGQMLHTGTGTSKDDEGRPGIGKSLQSWGISMLSMHLEHSGWKREVETAARQWNGLQKQQMQSTQPPSMCWGNYTRMVCILIKIWIRP